MVFTGTENLRGFRVGNCAADKDLTLGSGFIG